MRHFSRRVDWRPTVPFLFLILTSLTVPATWPMAVWGQPPSPTSSASPAAQQVRATLMQMHTWVGDNPNGQAWKRYLRSAALLQQLEKEQPDPAVIREALGQYESQADGLDRWQFAAVREALRTWLAQREPQAGQAPEEAASDEPPQSLVERVEEAAPEFRPITKQRVASHQQRLQQATNALDAFLAQGPYDNRMAWHRYLKWEEMQKQLSAGSPDLQALNTALSQYLTDHPGLELEVFRTVREALLDYMNAVYFSDEEEMQPFYRQQMEALAKHLRDYQESPSQEEALAIGRIVGFLVQAEQAPQIVEAIRAEYWQPNLFARVSRRLAAAGIRDQVDQVTGISENILGTAVYGTARMQGDVDVQLAPNAQKAQLEIQLSGAANSNNVGYNRGVQIYSFGYTSLGGSKTLLVDKEGVHVLPARASARTNTTITGVAANSNLVRRIAWKRIRQSEAQAERVASQRAAGRLASRMNLETADLVDDANQKFNEKFRNPLLRKGEFPEVLDFSSTEESILVTGLQANRFQLGAPDAPPALTGEWDLAVRAHESLVSNFSEAVLGGVTLTDEKAAELMKDLTGEVPEELQITEESDPWSITFANTQPIRAEFRDQGFKIVVRGGQFTRQQQKVNDDMEISATYRVEQTEKGLRLERVGEVEAKYVDVEFENATRLTIKTFMRKKFAALFKPELETDGLVLPGRWERAGTLSLQQFLSEDGWVALGWEQPAEPSPVAEQRADDGNRSPADAEE